ncbi:MAG: protein YgfX [Pseudomonadota bacterium]
MPLTDIKIRVSASFTTLLIVILCASLLIIGSLSIALAWKVLLISVALFYGLHILWKDCLLLSRHSITELILSPSSWKLITAHQTWEGELSGDSTLSVIASVLRFKVAGRKRKLSCVICADATDRDTYRQLLVLLRTTQAREAELVRRNRHEIH